MPAKNGDKAWCKAWELRAKANELYLEWNNNLAAISEAELMYSHRIRRYSRSVTQVSICPRFYKRFVINHAILASTTGTLYLPKPDKNLRLY
jgi:hypothetical protein